MMEFLYSVDTAIFRFCNHSLSNPLFDAIMPPITNWNQSPLGIAIFAAIWLFIFIKGGKRGRTAALLLIPLIYLSDQLSSTVIKSLIARPRPCHLAGGVPIISDIHLLVPCGSGYSFPSSHAANNFAFAALMTIYFRKFWYVFFTYAVLMGFSRISVGVHYPSDVLGGALIGVILSFLVYGIWYYFSRKYPALSLNDV
jgi:undecaprenyl-diphosphatase